MKTRRVALIAVSAYVTIMLIAILSIYVVFFHYDPVKEFGKDVREIKDRFEKGYHAKDSLKKDTIK